MDDTRFDQITRLLGSGVSRRTAIKAALGLGATGVVASQLAPSTDAARRPTPTPKPIVCQPPRILVGNQCVCPSGYATCGAECCPNGQAECCDGACCYGQCYGEELCCPNGSFLCNGVCSPFFDGSCCTDSDCTAEEECIQGECVLVCSPTGGVCDSNDDCCVGFCWQNECEVCFTGETRIAMADGTSRAIEQIQIGDLVLGDDGAVNRVNAIAMPLLGDRTLYGFDDSAGFVTGSHPFMTDDGWKAIEPADTYRDHRMPGVRQLTVSDRLVRLAGVLVPAGNMLPAHGEQVELRTEPQPIAQITPSSADPATQLYNLQLDGNHTYFANDLLVHNKP